jgi:hypothetical protein
LLERTRVQTDNQRDVMVLIASVHPLRFGGCPAEPVLIGCADSTVDNPALDEALSARCNSF